MPQMTLRIATDAQVGTPPGDTGRASGDWGPSGSADWGNCLRSTPDNLIVVTNTLNNPFNSRPRFLLDPNDIATLITNMGNAGAVLFLQPFVRALTFQGTGGPVNWSVTMEYPPSNNLTTLISVQTFINFWTNQSPNTASAAGLTALFNGPVQAFAPGGVAWTPAVLLQVEFGLMVQGIPQSRLGVDIVGVTVDYVTGSTRFPMPIVGGVAGCAV